jgi:arginase
MKNLALIGLPIYTRAQYRGMGQAVKALRKLGIPDLLKQHSSGFRDPGDVALSQIENDSGPSNLRNLTQFLIDTDAVQRATSGVQSDDFLFCLGGECALVVGSLAGLKTKFHDKAGVLWMDAHGDFNTPKTTVSGFIGGMCLAFACGRGPKLTSAVEGARPLLDEENVVHLGSRSLDPLEEKAMRSSHLKLYSALDANKIGMHEIAREAADYLAARSDWIICHLDVDSIDPRIISAVSFPEKGGLTLEEVLTVVRALQRTGKLKVFDLAAYNPMRDHNQESGKKLLKLVSEIFSVQPVP